ncbi:hypothetical protein B1992_02435 [Pseudoxanthomonas broegbernensis]|uniref:Uncharacterized protein n=1 Tax=Pseudoxanthomonas broegbernensis TaxID=83619 RepID=A0A7V8K7S0_9GAMM|nr:hypothetical protein [Pseudoxanthomonas broegbernensis]KAF1687542.1 hypothetical protein B1992_02435 [Pseudoxanthomonas broegbernensis]MBB6064552.1 hypothetical protein [Pseudoxanthomonas broegbernensis]
MSIVLYVGGSKDGTRGFLPNGFSKTMLETVEHGREIYVERMVRLARYGTVRVMALESLCEDLLASRAADHYAAAASAA